MKKSSRITLSVLCSFLVAALAVGCSKEATEVAADLSVNVPAQITALKGQDKAAVQNACIELAKAGPNAAPAIKDLIPLLKDDDALTRRLAAYVLCRIGPAAKEALPALEPLRNDPDQHVTLTAESALKAIDPEKYEKK